MTHCREGVFSLPGIKPDKTIQMEISHERIS